MLKSDCPECNGDGWVNVKVYGRSGTSYQDAERDCDECGGSGRVWTEVPYPQSWREWVTYGAIMFVTGFVLAFVLWF